VPVLARVIEAAGISTVVVTMMPYWSQPFGVPRTLAVEFPFVHPLGHAGDREEQVKVIRETLRVLRDAREPGMVEHLPDKWSGDHDEWYRRWQPPELPPVIVWLRKQQRKQAEERRREEGGQR
jgi:hypothetical protein